MGVNKSFQIENMAGSKGNIFPGIQLAGDLVDVAADTQQLGIGLKWA